MRYGNQALPSIHIIVDNGHVRLEGVVDNQFDDTLIRTRANAVPNVFSVDDDLVVLDQGEEETGLIKPVKDHPGAQGATPPHRGREPLRELPS